jgi:hypothetical protein
LKTLQDGIAPLGIDGFDELSGKTKIRTIRPNELSALINMHFQSAFGSGGIFAGVHGLFIGPGSIVVKKIG